MDYRIWMEEVVDLPAGYICAQGKGGVNVIFHRTTNKHEADIFADDVSAVYHAKEYKDAGYPCRIVPKISKKRIIEILF
jgi:hypothetical protein